MTVPSAIAAWVGLHAYASRILRDFILQETTKAPHFPDSSSD